MRLILSLFVLLLMLRTASGEETRQLGAHEHGHGEVNIAIEGNRVLMEFEAPGADLVGFEHAPATAAERAAIDGALAQLRQPLTMFVLPAAAGCAVAEAKVARVADSHDDDHDDHDKDEHDKHAHDDDDHDKDEHDKDDHDKDDHDKHAHDDDHDKDEHDEAAGEAHAEFRAAYTLDCRQPSAITSIRFAYFELFPRALELEVNVVGPAGQRQFEVERDEIVLRLEGVM